MRSNAIPLPDCLGKMRLLRRAFGAPRNDGLGWIPAYAGMTDRAGMAARTGVKTGVKRAVLNRNGGESLLLRQICDSKFDPETMQKMRPTEASSIVSGPFSPVIVKPTKSIKGDV